MPQSTTKYCSGCKQVKPISDFQPRSGRSGVETRCRHCRNARRKLNRPHLFVPAALVSDDTRRNRKERVDNWRQRHPEKYRAHVIVRKAIAAGKLIRPDVCEVCGNHGRIDAHHDDYSQPLSVRWLCKPCHCNYHKANRSEAK